MHTRLFFGAAMLVGLMAAPASGWAQGRQISGTVTRAAGGQPISEAVVAVAGAATSTRTNAEGHYTITAPEGEVKLVFRAIGFTRKDATVPPRQNTVNVVLNEDVLKLEEVVVTGQTTTLERRSATTATVNVHGDEVTAVPAQSLEQALQGKVLGATISMNSGAPGGGGQVQIRGASSILGSAQPAYIVDGILVSNDAFSSGANAVTRAGGSAIGNIGGSQDQLVNRLADINPAEIESIEILKSAAATAIYGSRATNGVVVIKTKRGQPGAPRFNVTQRLGVASPLRLLGYRKVSDLQTALGMAIVSGPGVPFTQQAFANGAAPLFDNAANLYSNRSPAHEELVNVSGGTESFRYFASATQRQEQGLAINTSARLQAVRINLDQRFSTKWKASAGLNVTRNLLKRGLGGNDNTNTSPIYGLAYTAPWIDLRTKDENGNFIENPFNGGGAGISNPFQTFSLLRADEDVFRQFGNANVSYTPLQTTVNLVTLSVTGGFDRFQQDGILLSPGFLQFELRPDRLGTSAQSNVNQYQYNAQIAGTWTYSPQAGKFNATTSVGTTFEQQSNNTYRLRGQGLLPGVTLVTQGTQSAEQIESLFKDESVFANEQILAFDQKLALNGGFRADRSSANGDVGHFYLFPRASASYRFDNLGGFVDNLKFRGGWGRTGNRPNFSSKYVVLAAGGLIDNRTSIVASGQVGNPVIKPETLTETEAGLDATLANSRISLEGTIYRRRITDLLLQPTLAPSSGLTSLLVNDGELESKGVEAGITVIPINTGKFQWVSRAAFQKTSQKVTSLPKYIAPFPVAGSFGASFGRNRICPACKTTWIWGNAPLDAAGKVLPVGSYVLNPGQVAGLRDTIIGDANPDFQVFFTNQLTYRNFTVSAQLDWRKGGDVADMTQVLYDEGQTSRDFDDPSPKQGVPLGQYRYDAWNGGSDARLYVQDGSFVRFREVAVSYEAPRRWANYLGARSLRFSAAARNFAIFSDYWSFDPEFNNFGNTNLNRFIDLAPYPASKSFYFSVDIGF